MTIPFVTLNALMSSAKSLLRLVFILPLNLPILKQYLEYSKKVHKYPD